MADKADSKDSAVVEQEDLQTEATSDSDDLAVIKKHAASDTPYFKIKALNTTSGNQHCYLSTLDNSMLYYPQVKRGNNSLIWVLKDQETHWFISNFVTERSNSIPKEQRTYMNLGTGVSGSPDTKYIVLFGSETKVYLEEISSARKTYAIYIYADDDNQTKAYLQPLSSEDETAIVAKVEEKPSYFFKIKPTKLDV